MIEIRRIAEGESTAVTELWDRMCRETPDGGPLTGRGRRNIERMLRLSDAHRDSCCLVAIEDAELVGFVCCEVDSGTGLLPGLAGEITALYVVPDVRGTGRSRRLAAAAVRWLRGHGVGTVRTLVCVDAADTRRFWEGVGFTADMVCLSHYPAD